MSVVKSITFVFENCECIVVEYPQVAAFHTGKIYENYSSCSNCIYRTQTVEGFTAVFNKKGSLSTDEYTSWLTEGHVPTLERLKGYDVTQLTITYEDKSEEHLSVLWEGDNDYTHDGQSCVITQEGNYMFVSESGGYKNTMEEDYADAFVMMSGV